MRAETPANCSDSVTKLILQINDINENSLFSRYKCSIRDTSSIERLNNSRFAVLKPRYEENVHAPRTGGVAAKIKDSLLSRVLA